MHNTLHIVSKSSGNLHHANSWLGPLGVGQYQDRFPRSLAVSPRTGTPDVHFRLGAVCFAPAESHSLGTEAADLKRSFSIASSGCLQRHRTLSERDFRFPASIPGRSGERSVQLTPVSTEGSQGIWLTEMESPEIQSQPPSPGQTPPPSSS